MPDSILPSPHEQRLRDEAAGKSNPEREKHPRLFALLDAFDGRPPSIDVERALLFTESMRATEGQPLALRWAMALEHIAAHITVYVDDLQLLAGRCGTDSGRYGILYPELDGDFLGESLARLAENIAAPIHISPENLRTVVEKIAPYWSGRTYHEDLNRSLPGELRPLVYDDPQGFTSRYIVHETSSLRASLQWVPDYEKVIRRGFADIRADVLRRMEALDPQSPADTLDKRPFLEAALRTCDAVVLWAKRHAELARRKARTETDPVRREELLEIAAIAERVPEFPARTFHEALQAQWFTQAFSRLEQRTGTIVSNGRMDQYLYPYFRRDMESGALTRERALELLDCLWANIAQFVDLAISPGSRESGEGYAHWEAVTIGGQTRDGRDAVNELSYLILESKRDCPLHYPELAVRIHDRTPDRFLQAVAESIKDGQGYPKVFNDEEIVPLRVAKGVEFGDARDYAVSGCASVRMPNRDTFTSGCTQLNLTAALEMTLFNGRMLRYGDELLGLETGSPENFADWNEFFRAYLRQQTNLQRHAFVVQGLINRTRARHFAGPLSSLLHDLCLDSCTDIHSDRPIPGGFDSAFFDMMGFATAIDSLAAIRRTVYDDKSLTMAGLVAALRDDFVGHEAVRELLCAAPRYGNNDMYADGIGREMERAAQEFSRRYARELGVMMDVRSISVTANVPFGKVLGASANGRRAGMPVSDGTSASQGADSHGPAAVLLSNFNTKNYDNKEREGRLLNIKFTPRSVAGEEGTRRLMAFLRSFCDLRLWHVQFNVINRETLIEAQRAPDLYRGLIVRIAGYSAYFVDLSRDLQNDLIARTSHDAW